MIPSGLTDTQYTYIIEETLREVALTVKRGTWPEVGHFGDVVKRKITQWSREEIKITNESVGPWTLDTNRINQQRLEQGEFVSEHWLKKQGTKHEN